MPANKTGGVLDGSPPKVLVHHDVSSPKGLAYDWIHRNLYWTDDGNNRIDVLGVFSGGDGDRWWRKTLFNTNLDQPRAIVVDPRSDQRWVLFVMMRGGGNEN